MTDIVTADELFGKKYGRLQIIGFSHRDKKSNRYYTCRCECGSEKVIAIHHLKSGTKSCGCMKVAKPVVSTEAVHDFFGLERFIKKYIEGAGIDNGIFSITQIVNQIIAGSNYTCKLISNYQLPQRF